jgi:hypothetical protein
MPFKSEKQRRFLWAEHPEIAKRWADKYPESNKGLPMYASDKAKKDDKTSPEEKAAQTTIMPANTGTADNKTKSYSILTPVESNENFKVADSKQEKVDIPHSEEPTYAGQEREKGMISGGVSNVQNVRENCGKNAINELLQKISVVLAPAIEQTKENLEAEREGRIPRRVGNNGGLKTYPLATPQIPLPMGMQQPQAQQPQQTQQTKPTNPASPTPVGAGQSSATTDPIKFHSGLSASGIINGNAALSAPNTVNTKISASGDTLLSDLMGINSLNPADIADLLELEADGRTGVKIAENILKWAGTPAWQRSAGKNDEGGLNAKGRASYNRATGGNLKAPVTEKNPKGERAGRQNSFCARMCGMKKHETGSKTKKDPDSRINKALRKWNCKCGSEKTAQDFDPALSRDAENSIMHGTGLVGSGVLGTAAGFPISAMLDGYLRKHNLMPDPSKNPWGNVAMSAATNVPMLAGGMLGMRLYDNYILRPHMRRELERKQQEDALRQQLLAKQSADASLQRILGTALASTGGGLLLGSYPGWKLQRASESAGNSDFTNFVAGKAPIALAGALSAGLYNHWLDQYEPKKKLKKQREPEGHPSLKYVKYLVH